MMLLGIYLDLPAWVRTTFALLVLTGGIVLTVYGYRGRPVFEESVNVHGDRSFEMKGDKPYADMALYCGMGVTAVGAALLTVCGTSDAEKHGYKF